MRKEANWENALGFKYTPTTPMGLCKELSPNVPKWIFQFGNWSSKWVKFFEQGLKEQTLFKLGPLETNVKVLKSKYQFIFSI
jgi:hypothetical protein